MYDDVSQSDIVVHGWGLLSQFSPFRHFPHFPWLSKQTLAIEYRVHIWQVSPQLSCGDTCQIWMWFRESNKYFCKIENFAYGEINEGSFSNPHPRFCIWSTLPERCFEFACETMPASWRFHKFKMVAASKPVQNSWIPLANTPQWHHVVPENLHLFQSLQQQTFYNIFY